MSSADNKPNFIPLDFYALGKCRNPPSRTQTNFGTNNAFRSTSNDLLHRNIFSINNQKFDSLKEDHKKLATIRDQNIPENSYMNPLNCFKTQQRFNLPTDMTNKETYNIAKEKLFSIDKYSTLTNGRHISKEEFNKSKKDYESERIKSNLQIKTNEGEESKTVDLRDNKLVFDKNAQGMLRMKGLCGPSQG